MKRIFRFFRYVASMFYDSLLVLGLLMIATAIAMAFGGGEFILPESPAFFLYLEIVVFTFFGYFWTHGGQTLGMLAWKYRLVRKDGRQITWRDALLRYLAATVSLLPFGAGFLWKLFDPQELTWHDRLSGTRLENA